MKLLRATKRIPGVGIHSGHEAWIQILPQEPSSTPYHPSAYRIKRGENGEFIPALFSKVTSTAYRTEIGGTFTTVEHVLAALWGLRVQAADLVVGGSSGEIPILDGSSLPFVQEILHAGLCEETEARPRFIVVHRPIEVKSADGQGFARLEPLASGSSKALVVDLEVEFPPKHAETCVYTHQWDSSTAGDVFVKEIAPARTFVNEQDISLLHSAGLGLGGNTSNCIVFSKATGEPLNTALRYVNERVRHKLLDVVGDLSLCGGFLIGRFTGRRTGHGLNNMLLRALFADPVNYEKL